MNGKPLGHIAGYLILLVYGAFAPIYHTVTTGNLVVPPYELMAVVLIVILGKDYRDLIKDGKHPFAKQ